jgi:hypothetical protein
MELLELGELAGGSLSNVQAEVAVEVPHLQRPREVAWFGVPDHAAGILVLACPLLNNGPIGLGAVPGIHAQVGGGSVRPVGGDELMQDEEAHSAAGDTARTRKPPLVIEGHQVGERPELVGLHVLSELRRRDREPFWRVRCEVHEMISRKSSTSMLVDSAVEPTKSQNMTVTWRRSAVSQGAGLRRRARPGSVRRLAFAGQQ